MRELLPYFQEVIRILREIDHECTFVNGPVALERDNQLGSLSFRLRRADEWDLTSIGVCLNHALSFVPI